MSKFSPQHHLVPALPPFPALLLSLPPPLSSPIPIRIRKAHEDLYEVGWSSKMYLSNVLGLGTVLDLITELQFLKFSLIIGHYFII